MSKRLIILTLALVLGISFAAYAEVQNVRVSGDITAMGVYRNNYDLTKNPPASASGTRDAEDYSDQREYFASITRLRVDSDLTDNVSATVRLLNERAWNGDSMTGGAGGNQNVGLGAPAWAGDRESQIDLDLGYITAREFLYSPLTLTVGRQELHFGNDFIIGDPDTNGISGRSQLPDGDLSARKAFDAIRATLDYNPLVVDIIYSKLAENAERLNDDTTLTGFYATYDLNRSTDVDGYFLAKLRGSRSAAVTSAAGNVYTAQVRNDKVYTLGVRAVNRSFDNLTLDVQGAYQFGAYEPQFDVNATAEARSARRSAFAAEVIATYSLADIDKIAKYDPSFSAIYAALSGNSRDAEGDRRYTGWDSMYENQTLGHIINGVFGFSNAHFAGASLKFSPLQDLLVRVDGVGIWTMKRYQDGTRYSLSGVSGSSNFFMNKNPHLGSELDVSLTYDYTEDVQFSLLGGVFFPGKAISRLRVAGDTTDSGLRAAATELLGTMKVTF